jgi:hypothetical protein
MASSLFSLPQLVNIPVVVILGAGTPAIGFHESQTL